MVLRVDIILFGATGLTGSYCIPYLHKLSKQKGRNLTWGIAGRSEEKLKSVLEKMSRKIDVDLSATPTFLADINDYPSLIAMTSQTRLLLNCCGPFRHSGKYAVKACLETGTHHIDVSAELDFSEYLETHIHDKAKEKGIYVLTSCGFDSIIYDMGLIYLQKKFEGIVNSADIYVNFLASPMNFSEPTVNFTTWASLIDILSEYDAYKDICRRAKPTNMPKLLPVLEKRRLPHRPINVEGWATPCLTNDEYVVAKTQEYFYKAQNKRPVQLGFYHIQQWLLTCILFQITYAVTSVLAKFKFIKKLLLDYATIFSLGYVGKNLKDETMEKSQMIVTIYAEGWDVQSLTNQENEFEIVRPVNSCILMTISAYNPGYRTAALCLVLSGIYLLTEIQSECCIAERGGVYTPGVVFEKTSIIEEIMEEGVEINLTRQKDILN